MKVFAGLQSPVNMAAPSKHKVRLSFFAIALSLTFFCHLIGS